MGILRMTGLLRCAANTARSKLPERYWHFEENVQNILDNFFTAGYKLKLGGHINVI